MKKYVASPNAEVIGVAMHNFFVSLNKDEFLSSVQQTFDTYGIDEIDDDAWYLHQISLDVFKQIDEQKFNASTNLVALGKAYVATALFPPEITTIKDGLVLLGQIYHLNIRNAPPNEGYEINVLSDNHIQIHDKNPFPHDTVYGFIWGICQRFCKPNEQFVVHRTFLNTANPDDDGAVYDVTIK